MIGRMLKWLASLLLLLLLLVVGAVAYFTATEDGLQRLLALGQRVAPGTLSWQQAEGRIAGPLDLAGFDYQQENGLQVNIRSVALRWQPQALLQRKLHLQRLALSGLTLHLPKPAADDLEQPAGPIELPDIDLPMDISIDELDLDDIRIYPWGKAQPIVIDRIKLAAVGGGSRLQVVQLDLHAPEGAASLSGTVEPQGDYPLDLKLDWHFNHPQFGAFAGSGAATGDLAMLHLTQHVSGPVGIDLVADLSDVLSKPAWDARLQLMADDLAAFSPALNGAPLQAEFRSAGSLDSFSAEGDLKTALPQTGPVAVDFSARGNTQAIELERLRLQPENQASELLLAGKVELAPLQFDLRGDWQQLGWPLQGEPIFSSPSGNVSVIGSLEDYRLSLAAEAAGRDIPSGRWTLTGHGSDSALSDFKLVGSLLDGEMTASGQASWKPQLSWHVSIDAKGINPAVQWPELPGKLDLALTSQGKLTSAGPDLTAHLAHLTGRFRDQPVRGQGEIVVADGELDIRRLDISSGKTALTANGHLGKQWDLDWRLLAPDLASLVPSLRGRISGSGKLSGDASNPVAVIDLDVRDLVAGDTRIGRLNGKALVDIGGQRRSQIDFSGTKLKLAGEAWSSLKISGGGKPAQHKLAVKLEGDLARLRLALEGGLKKARWQGKLTQLEATKTELGDWKMVRAAPLTASAEAAQLSGLCLASAPTRVCVDADWNKQKGVTGKLQLTELDAQRFRRFLPPDITLQTAVDGGVDFALAADGKPRVKADLRLRPGKLSAPGDVEPLEVRLGESQIKATLDGDRANTELSVDLDALGRIEARVAVRGIGASQPQLTGKVEGRIRDLAIISAFVPQLQAVEGRLDADLTLSGPVSLPVVSGKLLVDDFSAEVPEVSLNITAGRFELASDGKGPLRIAGGARSGEGTLKLSGTLDPATRALQLKINGDRFQVAATRNIRAVISPDMQIAMDSKGMRVEGELLIPSAYIKAGGGSGGEGKLVKVSSDVVIVDENGEAAKKAPAGNFHLNLRVVLGDDIRVEAADFSGKLKGNLLVTQKPGLVPRATGAIEVVNGDYIVYGQQLKIQRGRILFGGGPVDNPRLDMDVARRVEAYDVLAGARIRGTAQAPILQLYSEPSMPDSSILSYMLLGQPPGTKGGSYTLGKYLTPDLYVGYGIGLFNAINTFNMRYRLTDKLALQAASGAASSADLIYTFER